ncbi:MULTISPECIES: hypothetical protein [Haloferax]|uniref:NmrA family NAD(P)-binding protein n=1 Tax=Haloferax TaxID=2251 RepID=UPI001CD96508|nr:MULTISPECIES: hypothetical protein [Haloferax]
MGQTVAAAFADPDRFVGETIDLVGDALTPTEIAATFADVLDIAVEFVSVPLDEYREQRGDEIADMYAWFDDGAYDATRPDLSRFGISLRTLAQHLADNDTWRPAPAPVR